MVNYSNGFSLAFDPDHKVVVLNILQRFPELDETGTLSDDAKTTSFGSFVMEREVAENLATAILNIINDPVQYEPEDETDDNFSE